MTEVVTDRTTQFVLKPGQELEVRIKGREIEDVWTVVLDVELDSMAFFKGKTMVEVRLLAVV